MTISYGQEVATSSGLGVFWKLLFKWRGSVYKLVWQNLTLYILLYYSLSFSYRFIFDQSGREKFEQVSVHCQRFADLIPVTFVLGFYVSIVITRWWGQYKIIPWPDSCCLFISTCILGHDERGRLIRRTIARYLIFALIQTLRMTSIQVKKRFPTLSHLSEAGIITEHEQKIVEGLDDKCIQHPKYWLSLVWAGAVVTRAKKEGRIKDDFAFRTIIKEINKFRSGCGGLLDYDWISIPLVYTQVVTLAVYTFFLSSLMGRQFLDISKGYEGHEVDLYVPVFTFLQFFFYMGWLKVAEVLINPFGEDDDDFEMNWLIDRNLQVAYLIVDDMHAEHPELVKDQFWDEGVPDELPYTIAAEEFRGQEWLGSTAEVEVPEEQSEFVYLDKIDEEEIDDDETLECMDNLKDVEKGDLIKPSKPLNIANTKLKSVRDSISSNMSNIRRNDSSNSILGMVRRVMHNPSRSASRLNVNGLESSVHSINSRPGTGAGGMTARNSKHRKKKSSRTGFYRSISTASPMSHENLSQTISRVNTNERPIFKMSDTSSVGSLNTESEFPSRSNSEARALMEVREILNNDLKKRKESSNINEELKYRGSHKIKNDNKVLMLKRKLEQVQNLQAQIMKSLDNEIRESETEEVGTETEDAVHLLEQKTLELRNTLLELESDADTGTCTSPGHEMLDISLRKKSRSLRRSCNPSFSCEGTHSGQDRIQRGSVTSPSSPVPKICLEQEATAEISKLSKTFHPISSRGSEGSFSNDVFDVETTKDANDEEEPDNSNEEESEPQSVIENMKNVKGSDTEVESKTTKDEVSEIFDESWDNLGTIEEQPELGYQSDDSDAVNTHSYGDYNKTNISNEKKSSLSVIVEEK